MLARGAERPFADSILTRALFRVPSLREPVALRAFPGTRLRGSSCPNRIHKGWRAGLGRKQRMRTSLLLGAAAVGVLITGAIAQTSSNIERIKDPAGHQNATPATEPKKNVRTVY